MAKMFISSLTRRTVDVSNTSLSWFYNVHRTKHVVRTVSVLVGRSLKPGVGGRQPVGPRGVVPPGGVWRRGLRGPGSLAGEPR